MSKVIHVNLNSNGDFNKLTDINDQSLLTSIESSSPKSENDISYWVIIVDENKVACCAHIAGQNDIKQCTITIPQTDKRHKRKMIEEIQNTAFNTLGMESVFYKINPGDKSITDILTKLGLENLGSLENNNDRDIVFLSDNKAGQKNNPKGLMQ